MNNTSTSLIELQKGQRLIVDHALFFIKQGAFKKIKLTEDGREQIAHFYYPGEIIGCSSKKVSDRYYKIISLSKSRVYKISNQDILKQIRKNFKFQNIILNTMTKRMTLGACVILNASADERILSFLLNTFNINKFSNDDHALHLLMSHKEIANFLGLSPETISRRLKYLTAKGYFSYKNRSFENFEFEKIKNKLS